MPFMLQCSRRDPDLALRPKGGGTWELSSAKHLLQVTEAAPAGQAAAWPLLGTRQGLPQRFFSLIQSIDAFYNSYEQYMAFSKRASVHRLQAIPCSSSVFCKIALKVLLMLKPGTIFIDQDS